MTSSFFFLLLFVLIGLCMYNFFLKKTFKKFCFFSFLLLFTALEVNAQDKQKIAWVKKFQKAGDKSEVAAIASDKNDNIFVLLNTKKVNTLNSYLMLRNANGKKVWRVLLNINVIGQDLYSDKNGNVYVLGSVVEKGNSQQFIAKYNDQGEKQWEKILSEVLNYTSLQKILVDESENIYILGTSLAEEISNGIKAERIKRPEEINVVLYKFDNSRNFLFQKKYTNLGFGKNNVERTIIAKIDKNENIYIAGQTELLLRSSFVLKVSMYGDLLFKDFINVADSELFLSSLDFDEQENIYLSGGIRVKSDETVALYQGNEILNVKKYSLSSGSKDYFILKFNTKKNKKEWIRTYGNHQHVNNIHDLKVYENQFFVIGSSTENLNKNKESNEKHNIFIKRFDLNGVQNWIYSLPYAFNGDIKGYHKLKLTVNTEGSLIIGGVVKSSEDQNLGEKDYGALIKIRNTKKVTNNLHPVD